MTINQSHVNYAINGTKNAEHYIGEELLKQLPIALEKPVAVIASETEKGTSVVALLPFKHSGSTIVAPVYIDEYGMQNTVEIDSNAVTSIYGRKNAVTRLLSNAINSHNAGKVTEKPVPKVASFVNLNQNTKTVKLDNGETVNLSNVEYGSDSEGLLIEGIADMGVNSATANLLMRSYDGDNSVRSVSTYLNDVKRAYNAGLINYPLERMHNFSTDGTKVRSAWQAGQIQAKFDKVKSRVTPEKSGLYKNGQKTTAKEIIKNYKGLNEVQKTSLEVLERLSEALDSRIEVFESKVEDGRRVGENGKYHNGTIYVDLYAGESGSGTMLRTVSHEMVHMIKDYSREHFNTLADYVIKTYANNAVDVEELVERQQMIAKSDPTFNGELSYEAAFEEVVAESLERMLTDTDALTKIEELARKDKPLVQKMSDFVKKVLNKIKAIYKAYNGESYAVRNGLQDVVNEFQKLSDVFAEGVVNASKNIKAKRNNTATKESSGEVKFQLRRTTDNKPVVEITDDFLAGVPKNQWAKATKEALSNYKSGINFMQGIVKVNAISKNEFLNSKYSIYLKSHEKTAYKDKLLTADNLDEILKAAQNTKVEDLKHIRTDSFKQFAHSDVLIKVGNNGYIADVIVGITRDNAMVFYDIVNMIPTNIKIKKQTYNPKAMTESGSLLKGSAASTNSISSSSENVNTKHSRRDNDYLKAVKDNNIETAQKLIDEAAKEAGYNSPILYHGTSDFGFTEFDLNKMDDKRSIFLTSNKAIASTYSGVDTVRKVSEKSNVNVDKLSIGETVELMNKYPSDSTIDYSYSYITDVNAFKNKVASEVNTLSEMIESIPKDSLDEHDMRYINTITDAIKSKEYINLSTPLYTALSNTELFKNDKAFINNLEQDVRTLKYAEDTKSNEVIIEKALGGYSIEAMTLDEAKTNLKGNINKGNYSLYAKLENPLVIDAKGKVWNNINYEAIYNKYEVKQSENGYFIWNSSTYQPEWINGKREWNSREEAQKALDTLSDKNWYKRLYTTRDISQYAKSQGHDGVIFKDLRDNGGMNSKVGMDTKADIYVVFNPNNVKSADPVTYDNNGDVIPLSERFNDEKKDIRYSRRDYTFSKALTSEEWKKYNNSMTTGVDAGLRINDNSTLVECENGDFEYKYVIYDNEVEDKRILAVYGIRTNYEKATAREIAETLYDLEEMGYAERNANKILNRIAKNYEALLGRYSSKNSRFVRSRKWNTGIGKVDGEGTSGEGVSQGVKYSRRDQFARDLKREYKYTDAVENVAKQLESIEGMQTNATSSKLNNAPFLPYRSTKMVV